MKGNDIFLLREDSRNVVRELGLLDNDYKNCGLALTECHILLEIWQRPYPTIGDLAQWLNLDKSSVSRFIAKMIEKKLIDCTEDPADKRRRPLHLTKTGIALAERIDKLAYGQVEDALHQLSPEEKKSVLQGMHLYAKALRKSRLLQNLSIQELSPGIAIEMTKVILDVLEEYDCKKPGFASQDEEIHAFFDAYQKPGTKYFVVLRGDKVVGGAGIGPLTGGDKQTCELRKMYLLKEARGLGIGSMLLDKCLQAAKKMGYRLCYLETTDIMREAQELYIKKGFKELKKRLGNSGHWACEKFYGKEL